MQVQRDEDNESLRQGHPLARIAFVAGMDVHEYGKCRRILPFL